MLFAEGKEKRTKDAYLCYGKKLDAFLTCKRIQLDNMKPRDAKDFITEAGTNEDGKEVMNSKAMYKQYLCSVVRFIGRQDLADYIQKEHERNP